MGLLQREGNLNVETSGGHVTLGETPTADQSDAP